jgi:hypothetical protein
MSSNFNSKFLERRRIERENLHPRILFRLRRSRLEGWPRVFGGGFVQKFQNAFNPANLGTFANGQEPRLISCLMFVQKGDPTSLMGAVVWDSVPPELVTMLKSGDFGQSP